ncbi:bifunctional sugar phosphate isomerase/epimerase/4-hydroxyphenylpyruvate dioxygenase family protein [Naasia lichenicola]|uniref:3-dehydroshikimate dehydratase n=1 Tax=Naasia lichenicola TaxID=2565933 RepID=A0A4S4FGE0_9MICO|nr:sugar phosphate isomerase/epimerase and 4-hydroxyphenylpyruvate domain-containing protein [Naasia lichenicola]THG29309.1 sugar phosphate isomerase/epimerase and 4-hydroxyphenylpyruvate domain-containing protein [Naasia lichenicola]
MHTSIATVCLSGTLEQKLHAVAAAGFDGVELFENDLIASTLSIEAIRAMTEDLGLSIDLYQPLRDVEGVPEEKWSATLARASAKFRLAASLGAPTVLVCSSVRSDTVQDDAVIVRQLRALGDEANRAGVTIAYEALAWGRHVSTWDHAWRLVEAADHPAVGLCLDSFHILSLGSDPSAIAQIPGEKILFCQLADAPSMQLDVLSWSRHHRVFPGQGDFDLVPFMRALLATGYDGPLSIEVFNDVFRQIDPVANAIDARRSLLNLQNAVANAIELTGGEPPAGLTRVTHSRPAEDFSFVELAASPGQELPAVLISLGFRFRGRHRTKPLTLYTQGVIRLVLNEAAAQDLGSIVGIGFEVPSVDAASQRATDLLAMEVNRSTDAGEELLRVFRAPDGTEVSFAAECLTGDPGWVAEFVGGEPAARTAPLDGVHHLEQIDHVSLAQPWQHFDEAVLFYKSLLGLRPLSSTDVADAHGLIRSQVMQTGSGTVTVVMNVLPAAPANAKDIADQYADHIAFQTPDLRGLARALQSEGVPMLHIPANYYDDLEARFDITRAERLELQALNVLYDEDERGTFLQAYTIPVGKVFVELVQRDRYSGFGAANSSVRRAAQSMATQLGR